MTKEQAKIIILKSAAEHSYKDGYKKGYRDACNRIAQLVKIHLNIDMDQVIAGTTDKG